MSLSDSEMAATLGRLRQSHSPIPIPSSPRKVTLRFVR